MRKVARDLFLFLTKSAVKSRKLDQTSLICETDPSEI